MSSRRPRLSKIWAVAQCLPRSESQASVRAALLHTVPRPCHRDTVPERANVVMRFLHQEGGISALFQRIKLGYFFCCF